MIDRDQVLHVAKLARLRLSEEEIERMSGELSTILDHIEKIEELELSDVEPTSHVIQLENVLRSDEPRPSWPRERVLEPAPDSADDGFRVPSPGAHA
jgi:aspartyl-tRNA(Asn)/glutamyl-tRNA(Gln) amidotransferase subunit C